MVGQREGVGTLYLRFMYALCTAYLRFMYGLSLGRSGEEVGGGCLGGVQSGGAKIEPGLSGIYLVGALHALRRFQIVNSLDGRWLLLGQVRILAPRAHSAGAERLSKRPR